MKKSLELVYLQNIKKIIRFDSWVRKSQRNLFNMWKVGFFHKLKEPSVPELEKILINASIKLVDHVLKLMLGLHVT